MALILISLNRKSNCFRASQLTIPVVGVKRESVLSNEIYVHISL